jgi:hypothetical protein
MTRIVLLAVLALWTAPAMGQSDNNNQALADCVQAANQKYKDTWEAVCAKLAKDPIFLVQHPDCCKGRHCTEFIGSPRDKEFSQLRIEELTVCSKLYSR